MVLVFVSFVVVVLATAGGYFLLDSRMRRSDLDSIKSRLLGSTGTKSKRKDAAPALMQNPDRPKDRMGLELLRRLRLGHSLKQLLEHAGLRWPVMRLVRLIAGCFLCAFAAAWYLLPPPLDRAAFLIGPLGGGFARLVCLAKEPAAAAQVRRPVPGSPGVRGARHARGTCILRLA